MKGKLLNIFLVILLVISSIYYFFTVINLKEKIKSYKQLQETNINLNKGIAKDNIDYYKKLTQRCVNVLNEEQLIEVAKQECVYTIKINGKEFNGDSLKIDGTNIEILISESREKFSFLPDALRLKGQLKDFHKQFSVQTNAKYDVKSTDDEYETSVLYRITNLSHGDSVKFTMSDDLRTRFRLPSTKYTIYIK